MQVDQAQTWNQSIIQKYIKLVERNAPNYELRNNKTLTMGLTFSTLLLADFQNDYHFGCETLSECLKRVKNVN